MQRREFLKATGATAAGLTVTRAVAANPKNGRRPNLLFIMTDQQHAGMMSCSGNENLNTPAMDSIAREGVRFKHGCVCNPVCMPSRIGMATGVMPGRLGVFSNGMKANVPNEVDENSLGKLIKRAGYDTFYGGKTHLCPELVPHKAGYDVFDRDSRAGLPDACSDFIRRDRDRPFFAVASFINPHDICFAHRAREKTSKNMASVNELYRQAVSLPEDQLPPLPENFAIPQREPGAIEAGMSPRAVTPAITMRKDYDERDWRIYRWIYCRLTEQVDRHIGKILDTLKETGQDEDTLVLFTSDHGNMDASHRLASKGLFYEESVSVPFLMRYKRAIPAGQVNADHLVSTGLDILPTLCDYAGVTPPSTLLGTSLRPIAEGRQVDSRRPYVVSENNLGRMVRTARFKYCVYQSGPLRESLVDLDKDPGEMLNLVSMPEHKDTLRKHRRYLREWIQESGDTEARAFVVRSG